MAVVNINTIAAYRWSCWLKLIGFVQGSTATWHCMLHLSHEPGELLQYQCQCLWCHNDRP